VCSGPLQTSLVPQTLDRSPNTHPASLDFLSTPGAPLLFFHRLPTLCALPLYYAGRFYGEYQEDLVAARFDEADVDGGGEAELGDSNVGNQDSAHW